MMSSLVSLAHTLGPALRGHVHEATALRNALCKAEQVGSFITLKNGAEWPHLGDVPLYVRSFYDGLYKGPLQFFTADKNAEYRQFVIVGNSGIGKASLGCYLLWRAVREGRTVLYRNARLGSAFVFHGDGRAEELPNDDFSRSWPVADLLNDPSTVLISDSVPSYREKAFTVLLAAADKRDVWHAHGFEESAKCDMLYLPVFSWPEILELQEKCFPELSTDLAGVRDRFVRWGGIPRYVLSKPGKGYQSRIESLSASSDYAGMTDYLIHHERKCRASASEVLLHVKTKGELDPSLSPTGLAFHQHARTEFGSRYLMDKVYRAIRESPRNALRFLMHLPSGSYPADSSRQLVQDVFERHARDALAAGGSFRMRSLDDKGTGAETLLTLPSASSGGSLPAIAAFHTPEELKSLVSSSSLSSSASSSAGRLFQPTSKSFCSVDFIFQGNRPANAAVGKTRDLVLASNGKHAPAGLLPVAEALGMSSPLQFFWLVPESDFNSWEKPQRVVVDGKDAPSADAAKVQQFVVAVPFDVSAVNLTPASAKASVVGQKRRRPNKGAAKGSKEEEEENADERVDKKSEQKRSKKSKSEDEL